MTLSFLTSFMSIPWRLISVMLSFLLPPWKLNTISILTILNLSFNLDWTNSTNRSKQSPFKINFQNMPWLVLSKRISSISLLFLMQTLPPSTPLLSFLMLILKTLLSSFYKENIDITGSWLTSLHPPFNITATFKTSFLFMATNLIPDPCVKTIGSEQRIGWRNAFG